MLQKSQRSRSDMSPVLLSIKQQMLFYFFSWLIVAFGQPAWNSVLGIASSAFGYALFLRVLLCYSSWKHRFLLSVSWFALVQFIQLSWFLSHPYIYIYAVFLIISLLLGIQFGILGIFIDQQHFQKLGSLLAIAGLWTLMEWSRLFFFSGFSWNPSGLALTSTIYSFQMASLAGVFGLSFWVIWVNLLAVKFWVFNRTFTYAGLWLAAVMVPYVYGTIQIGIHSQKFTEGDASSLNVVLVQPAFPVEEEMDFKDKHALMKYVLNEWRQILTITKKQQGKPIDLIVLPEFVVPYGTYSFVYPFEEVKRAFIDIFGGESVKVLPSLKLPLASTFTDSGYLVNNAYWAQSLANLFRSGILVGLEDAERTPQGIELYSAAVYFRPIEDHPNDDFLKPLGRYDKRVLVPMGEYIPFAFCRSLASSYGVYGSFTCGKEAKIFKANNCSFGVSICYEETFGDIVRENKVLGASLLANLTNDAWYPYSRLAQQHFDHAKVRTVECGIPMVRACNTGLTGAVDSLGRDISLLKREGVPLDVLSDSLHVKVPLYTYSTLYTQVGDGFIVALSAMLVLFFLRFNPK